MAVGPATIYDGTYELYSVRHSGAYEALHVRTAYWNGSINAVYMAPEGIVSHLATEINIHTRTGNHVIQNAMWSAGCILVGDGDWSEYAQLMASTYYSNYDTFETDRKVGCLIIDRQNLKQEMYALYENRNAVDMLLSASAKIQPNVYLEKCTAEPPFEEYFRVEAIRSTGLMSLPCTNAQDARSVAVTSISEGDKLELNRKVINARGHVWYEVVFIGSPCYVYAGDVEEAPKTVFERIAEFFRG